MLGDAKYVPDTFFQCLCKMIPGTFFIRKYYEFIKKYYEG